MSYHQLTEEERYQISVLLKAEHNQKETAALLERWASTISRELKRNRCLRGYRPAQAQRLSDSRRTEARKATDEVKGWVGQLIRKGLSPQQVVGYLERHKKLSLHHETIYQLIYADKAGDHEYERSGVEGESESHYLR